MNDLYIKLLHNRQENKDEMFQKLLLFMTIICSGVKWCHSKIINICTTGSPPVTRPPITRKIFSTKLVLTRKGPLGPC